MLRQSVLLAAGAMLAVCLPGSPAKAELVVTISKADQRMSVSVDGSEMYRWPVSTGRGRYATPSGHWRPVRFERSWYSRKYDNAPMPFSIFFHRGYAVHGTTEVHQLGRAASHGCVRLHPDNAATLFSIARAQGALGTRIVVTGLRLDGAAAPAAAPVEERRPQRQQRQRHREPSVEREQRIDPRYPRNGFEAFGKLAPNEDDSGVKTDKTDSVAAAPAPASRAQSVTVSARSLPAEVLRPGTHIVTMKVGSDAELRAVYRKYGFTW